MYEEKENKISWISILKKILLYLLAVVVILGVIALITRCARNSSKDEKTVVKVELSKEVIALRDATIKYLTVDNLPQKDGESRSIKLKYLIAKDLIKPISDSEGNTCDTNESYSEVTRSKNNYYMVTKIKCGKNEETLKDYIGCFAKCNGKICIGEQNDKGICEKVEQTDNTTTKKENTDKAPSENSSSSSQKTCYDHIKYSCSSGYVITNDNRCKRKTVTTEVTKIKFAEEYFYTKEKKYPVEYYSSPKIGYLYEWSFEEYQKIISLYIWRRTIYTLCPNGYNYNLAKNICEKEFYNDLYSAAKKTHKYSYNKNESGYIYNGTANSSKCK